MTRKTRDVTRCETRRLHHRHVLTATDPTCPIVPETRMGELAKGIVWIVEVHEFVRGYQWQFSWKGIPVDQPVRTVHWRESRVALAADFGRLT